MPKILARSIPLLFCAAFAYSQSEHVPQPSPELRKLDYFAGTWKTEAQMKAGPAGPGGPLSSTDHVEWQQGNFFLIDHTDFKTSMFNGTEIAILGYDPNKKVFTYNSFNSSGEHEVATGNLAGDTWTWMSAESSPMKWRYVETIVSPTQYRIKFEMSQDGAQWTPIMEGTANKQ